MSAAKFTYRPDIDGLRAIAVVSVLLYHAGFSFGGRDLFQGGFLGVDVFFVISGYLITSILLKELETTHRISITRFYERRARRILPALFIVMIASFPLGWEYLFPTDFADFSKSLLYTLGFGSNFYFYSTGLRYGATAGEYLPFLHTWSLSVEEQFYLIFPVLLFVAYRYFRRFIPAMLILGFLLSLTAADWTSRHHASLVFYFLHTRMWELLAGAALSYLEITRGRRFSPSMLTTMLSAVGMTMIMASMYLFDSNTPHPSFHTLVPIAGVCLVIWFAHKDDMLTRVLSTRLFVGVGLISYSLYLWHHPVYVFGRVQQALKSSQPSDLDRALWILISLALAAASYFLVERPFRSPRALGRRSLVLVLATTLAFVVLGNILVVSDQGIKSRFAGLYGFVDNTIEFDNRQLRVSSWIHARSKQSFTDDSSSKLLMIGDSHSKDMFNVFYLNADLFPGLEVVQQTFSLIPDRKLTAEAVRDSFERLGDSESFTRADMIAISDATQMDQLSHLELLIRYLLGQKKHVVLMSHSSMFESAGWNLTLLDSFIVRKYRRNSQFTADDYSAIEELYFSRLDDSVRHVNEALQAIAERHGVPFLKKHDYQCDESARRCDVFTDAGSKIYFDSGHYTLEGAEYFGRKIHEMGWFDPK